MSSQELASPNRALNHAIVDSGLTQRRIAKRARLDETRLSKIKHGRAIATAREKEKLAKVLGCQRADLFPADDAAALAEAR